MRPPALLALCVFAAVIALVAGSAATWADSVRIGLALGLAGLLLHKAWYDPEFWSP